MALQKTIKNSIKFKGIGLHSGKDIKVELKPAPENTGIVFKRLDIEPITDIPASFINVQNTMLATSIVKNGIEIKTIEHLFAALSSLEIDNLYVEIDGAEVPIMDGSSEPFLFILKAAGIKTLDCPKRKIKILKKVIVEEDDKWASLEPFEGFEIEFEISYNSKVIKETLQKTTFNPENECFEKNISRARTFGFSEQVNTLKKQNFILGGSLKNAILINKDNIENAEGLRLHNEFVKHKILDAIGDLYLLNHKIEGKYKGYKSGHSLNNKLLRKLMESNDNYCYI